MLNTMAVRANYFAVADRIEATYATLNDVMNITPGRIPPAPLARIALYADDGL
jgi:hypothetical protein